MDLYRLDCFPMRLPQRALHTGKLGEKNPMQTTKKTFCFTHASLFWPLLLLHFDNRLEQNPKLISHASIQNNPGSWKRVIQDHCDTNTLLPLFSPKIMPKLRVRSLQITVSTVKQSLLQKVIKCCERSCGGWREGGSLTLSLLVDD